MSRARQSDDNTQVLIVGAGPVGLALALDLGWRGIACCVIEQNGGVIEHPRATAINARTMELFRRWGIADRVRKAATPPDFPHTALYVTSLQGYEIARVERPGRGNSKPSNSPEWSQRCNQLWLDPILRDAATACPTVSLRYHSRFQSFVEEADGVVATFEDRSTGERRTIAADYLVDCSGGYSAIRKGLGVAMSGESETDHHLSVFLRIPELWNYHDKGQAALIAFVDPKGIWRNLVQLDSERWRFTVTGKAFYDNPDGTDVLGLLDEVIGKTAPRDIISTGRWTARDVVADRYRVGRVFFAGDAAHLNHPNGGHGLNTGIGDAANLGWKLAAVIEGWGGPAMLESYETERRPVGLRNVGEASFGHQVWKTPTHPALLDDGPDGEHARRTVGDALLAVLKRIVVSDGLALGYSYDGSPVIWDDGTPAPPFKSDEYHPTSRPGARAPHAWLADGRSLLDLLRRDFVLLRLGDDPPSTAPIEAAFAHRGVPLEVAVVPGAEVGALYERRLVLARPDGHVAWRSDAVPDDPAVLVDRLRGGVPDARASRSAAGDLVRSS